ncbi:MAG: two-component regulator propeller domain-containing protein [Bacteroidales bacterium]
MKRKLLLLGLIMFFKSSYPQVHDLKFYSLPNENNLSGSFTTSIAQDTLGYIWIGTTNGLNRFNGYDFKVYKKKQNDINSLVSNNIFNLFTDSKGRLWIGSGFGLCIYNPLYDSFTRVASTDDSSGLECLYIKYINEDRHKNLYVAAENKIYIFNEARNMFSEIISLESYFIKTFLFDLQNNLWIGTGDEGGLFCYNILNKSLIRYIADNNNTNSLSNNNIVSLALRDGILWMTTLGGGINSLNLNNKIIKRYPFGESYESFGRSMYLDKNNYLWQCDLTGIKLYDESTDSFFGYYFNETDPFSIKKTAVSIFQDRQGNYWTLHSPGGVGISYIPRGFYGSGANSSEYSIPSNENISAISEDIQGNLWLGMYNNGVDVINGLLHEKITYYNDPSDKQSFGRGSVYTIFRDSEDVMWAGTYFGGLQYFDPTTSRFFSFTHVPGDSGSIACNDVRSVAEDSKGNLWLAVHGKGVDKFNKKDRKFSHFNASKNNLSNDWAYQVLCDHEDNIWVATVWGLNRLKKDEKLFENYISDENDTSSLTGNEVLSLYQDKDKNIWIGTTNGLNFYDKNTNAFKRINLNSSCNHICAILDDREGNIWVSTLKGLVWFNLKSGKSLEFDKNDGLFAGEFNVRAAYKNNENVLFFGNIKGVNYFNPDSLKINKTIPKVIISGIKLFYEEVTDYSPNSILQKHISYTDTLILKYMQSIITFEFLALNLIHADKNQYEYMLEGFDPKWNRSGNRREASYTNLNPGKYTFRVRASNNDGLWNYEGASIYLRILPPWYRTWWFYTLCVLFISGSFIFIYLYRTAQLRKQKNLLSQKVDESTRQLKEINKLLKAQTTDLNNTNALLEERQQQIEEQSTSLANANEELKVLNSGKDKLFSIIAHDLRGPFNNILGFSDILLNDFEKMDEIQKKNIAGYIYTSTNKVYNLLENLLKWAASQINKISFTPELINTHKLVTDNLKLYHEIARKKGVDIIFKESGVEYVFADYEMVNTIMRNLITNAIKFSLEGGVVEVLTVKEKKHAKISVTDNGIGMEKKFLDHLFSTEYNESRPGTNDERGSGLGLILCKEFVEKNGGVISVLSEVGKGSTFSFTLPLDQGTVNTESTS